MKLPTLVHCLSRLCEHGDDIADFGVVPEERFSIACCADTVATDYALNMQRHERLRPGTRRVTHKYLEVAQ